MDLVVRAGYCALCKLSQRKRLHTVGYNGFVGFYSSEITVPQPATLQFSTGTVLLKPDQLTGGAGRGMSSNNGRKRTCRTDRFQFSAGIGFRSTVTLVALNWVS